MRIFWRSSRERVRNVVRAFAVDGEVLVEETTRLDWFSEDLPDAIGEAIVDCSIRLGMWNDKEMVNYLLRCLVEMMLTSWWLLVLFARGVVARKKRWSIVSQYEAGSISGRFGMGSR